MLNASWILTNAKSTLALLTPPHAQEHLLDLCRNNFIGSVSETWNFFNENIYRAWYCLPFFILEIFKQIFKHIYTPLLGLFWKTEKCRSEEIRGGTFSIRRLCFKIQQLSEHDRIYHASICFQSCVVSINKVLQIHFEPIFVTFIGGKVHSSIKLKNLKNQSCCCCCCY